MHRRFLVAANWKMYPVPEGALDPNSPYHEHSDVDVIVFPTHLDLRPCTAAGLITGAQCGRREPKGEFTGDVSMEMIAEQGARYVLCGHSERRAHHGETSEQVAGQAVAALEAYLHPVVCVGETADERKEGREKKVVEQQLKGLPLHSENIILAYEPVWAIGKNALRPATPEEAQQMHAFVRSLLPAERRNTTCILYGGSVKQKNAEDLFRQHDIDGGLVGSASLRPDEFREIVAVASRLTSEGA